MTVDTLRRILGSMPNGVEVFFFSPGITFSINTVRCTQLSNEDPLEVVLEGEKT